MLKGSSLFFCLLLFSCGDEKPIIKIKGSDTEVNLSVNLAESFHQANPGTLVSVSGGGSGLGIASLLNGTTHIANSSRSIKKEEIELFRLREITIDSFIFAQDAVAFVVSGNNPLDSVRIDQLAKILSGEYKNWNTLTQTDLPINIYGRQSNSGTYDFVKETLHISFAPTAKQMNGNAQILEAIKVDASGIGYVGAGYVSKGGDQGIKVLSIYDSAQQKAISPLDNQSIISGTYYFQRPLFQYFKSVDYHHVKPFLDFEKSAEGLKIIEASGYYPVTEYYVNNKQARKPGLGL